MNDVALLDEIEKQNTLGAIFVAWSIFEQGKKCTVQEIIKNCEYLKGVQLTYTYQWYFEKAFDLGYISIHKKEGTNECEIGVTKTFREVFNLHG